MNGPPAPVSVSRGSTSTPPTVKIRNGAASSAAKARYTAPALPLGSMRARPGPAVCRDATASSLRAIMARDPSYARGGR